MAKLVYACVRDIAHVPEIKRRIGAIIQKLVPDNIPTAQCKVVQEGNIVYGISTYTEVIVEKNDSVCMGITFKGSENWYQPLTGHPEGNYAIFRANEICVEALTDMGCTRAVWYYKDEKIFITGTSQRAVIAVSGQFEFDNRNIPWMLSAGSLAPDLSWSKNLHFVKPDGAVLLNKKTWEITTQHTPPVYKFSNHSFKTIRNDFKKALIETFNKIDIDLSKWVLPISGGYDSRSIALLFRTIGKDISKLKTITWGLAASEQNKQSDGYLGGEIARRLGMEHEFWPTDNMKEPLEKVFERFIHCSEGRVDHIGGYTDGMTIWKNIFESQKHGIIRGDEDFGARPSNTFLRSRLLNECKLCTDFSNMNDYEKVGFEKQVLPDYMKENAETETPDIYRERLYQEYRLPYIMSALSDIKYAYTELINPLLAKSILFNSRTVPDNLRNRRKLFKIIVNEMSPDLGYAMDKATVLNDVSINTSEAYQLLIKEISADYMKTIFPHTFLNDLLNKLLQLPVHPKKNSFKKVKEIISRNMPVVIKERIRINLPKPALDTAVLAFRVYIIGKSYQLFNEDLTSIKQ